MKRKAFVFILLVCTVFAAYALKPPLKQGISFSQAVYDRDHRLLRLTLSRDDKYRLWLHLSDISPILVESTLLHEDKNFLYHHGADLPALLRAAWHTYVKRDCRMGGSTITMQLARIRFGIHSRTVIGKLKQVLTAWYLELFYSKKDILEVYLNLAPYGRNIEGVGAASLIYFNKDAAKLTLSEALTLSVIPQSPARRISSVRVSEDHSPEDLSVARMRLFSKWIEAHPLDREQSQFIALPIHLHWPSALPFSAPHFVNSVLHEEPEKSRITTTLDLRLQRLVERHVQRYIETKEHVGIRNASAMLLDFRTMEVRAVLGSVNFFDPLIQGQVDGTRAKRSPGSAVKPLIYALGMDQGIIHPMTVLKDAPMSFGDFNPENFDGEFTGPIKAKDALVKSRNLPAVQVASKLTNPSLYGFLRKAGISRLREESFYGMALALGSAELTMEELVRFYAMLANEGMLKPLKTHLGEPSEEGIRLLSKEACFMVLDILKDNPRPSQGYQSDWVRDSLPVAWKTGTSYAFRDAWAIGIFGPYVLAVWIGNFDGEGNPAFIGREAAAPLFFQIIDSIKSMKSNLNEVVTTNLIDLDLMKVDICAVSGQIPGPSCPTSATTWFIPGKSPITVCDIHRTVSINIRTGLRACTDSAPGTRPAVYEFWPSDMLMIFRQAGIPRRVPPPYSPECAIETKAGKGIAPQITSPQSGTEYSIRAAAVERDRIPFAAITDADVREVYWFVNEKFLGRSSGGNPFFWSSKPGTFIVRVVDDHGRSDARKIKVTVVE